MLKTYYNILYQINIIQRPLVKELPQFGMGVCVKYFCFASVMIYISCLGVETLSKFSLPHLKQSSEGRLRKAKFCPSNTMLPWSRN